MFLKMINSVIRRRLEALLYPYPEVSEDGDMMFSVSIRELGFANGDIDALKEMFRIRFYSDFIAETLLRRNVGHFMAMIAEEKWYELDVKLAAHQHYGVAIDRGRIFLIFHVSRLAEIANEEIHEVLKWQGQNQSWN